MCGLDEIAPVSGSRLKGFGVEVCMSVHVYGLCHEGAKLAIANTNPKFYEF